MARIDEMHYVSKLLGLFTPLPEVNSAEIILDMVSLQRALSTGRISCRKSFWNFYWNEENFTHERPHDLITFISFLNRKCVLCKLPFISTGSANKPIINCQWKLRIMQSQFLKLFSNQGCERMCVTSLMLLQIIPLFSEKLTLPYLLQLWEPC